MHGYTESQGYIDIMIHRVSWLSSQPRTIHVVFFTRDVSASTCPRKHFGLSHGHGEPKDVAANGAGGVGFKPSCCVYIKSHRDSDN